MMKRILAGLLVMLTLRAVGTRRTEHLRRQGRFGMRASPA
jgi:hypothetical protein